MLTKKLTKGKRKMNLMTRTNTRVIGCGLQARRRNASVD